MQTVVFQRWLQLAQLLLVHVAYSIPFLLIFLGPRHLSTDSGRFAVSVCVFERSGDALGVEIEPFFVKSQKSNYFV